MNSNLINDFFEKCDYPAYVELNHQLRPLLIEWSETQDDRRLHGDHITFFQLETSWHSQDNLHELEPFHKLRDFIEDLVHQKLNKQL
ncbi:MAG: hypothetical protein ACKVTZ_07195, partial [Bacteroidia bacterium]